MTRLWPLSTACMTITSIDDVYPHAPVFEQIIGMSPLALMRDNVKTIAGTVTVATAPAMAIPIDCWEKFGPCP